MKIHSWKKEAENTYFRMPRHAECLLVKRDGFLHAGRLACEMTDDKKWGPPPRHKLDNDFNLIGKYW